MNSKYKTELHKHKILKEKRKCRRPHSHRAGKARAAALDNEAELAARWRAAERVAARRRSVEAAGGGEDEGACGVEAGAAKTKWHGARDGGAPVSGLAGSSSKAAGAWRRRSSGRARGWWGTSTAAEQEARWEQGRRRRHGADQELCPSVGARWSKKGHI